VQNLNQGTETKADLLAVAPEPGLFSLVRVFIDVLLVIILHAGSSDAEGNERVVCTLNGRHREVEFGCTYTPSILGKQRIAMSQSQAVNGKIINPTSDASSIHASQAAHSTCKLTFLT
jgi:hypothetical protein